MGNFKILIKGMILSFQKRRLAVRLWAINLIFSLFAIGPFFFLMIKHMSHSFSGERALQKLDLFWLADFVYRFINIAPALVGVLLLASVLHLLLFVFLNGGIIGGLNRPLLILLVFLWQQIYMFCRQWSKVLFFATGLKFVEQHQKPVH